MIDEEFDFNKSIKNMTGIYDKINEIAEEYDPKKG